MATQTSTSNDKPFGISQIRAYVPIILDMEKLNYDKWRELFETHCLCYGVLCHLDGSSRPSSVTDTTWKERDGLVKMWIYGTISESILDTVIKAKCSARDLWLTIEALFRDNKEARALQLENELRTITIGDQSVHEYCKKLKNLSDLLANIDPPVPDRGLVLHLLNGLTDKFDSIINVIKHREPFPTFSTARSMLILEEDRLSKQQRVTPTTSHQPSSPDVLFTASDHGTRQHQSGSPYRGGRGRGRGGRNNRGGRGRHHNNYWPSSHYNWNHGSTHAPYQYQYGPPPPPPYYAPSPLHHTFRPSQHYQSHPSNQAPGILGSHPASSNAAAHVIQGPSFSPDQFSDQQAYVPSALAHAFNTMTLQDPNNGPWVMDSGATNHVTNTQGNLSSIHNLSSIPMIKVGNGSFAPVTNVGHGTLHSPSRPFHLKNILVCPSIIKNLISVRRFVTDNNCSLELIHLAFL